MTQSLADKTQLSLVGIGADEAKTQLCKALKDKFKEYTLVTKSIEHIAQHVTEFCGAAKTFNVVKEKEIGNSGKSEIDGTATCNLIIECRKFVRRKREYTAYYAYVPAHLVLGKERCRDLQTKETAENINLNLETAGKNFYLQTPKRDKWLTLRTDKIPLSYRHGRLEQDQGAGESARPPYELFLNDSALLEIEGRELLCKDPETISKDELASAMQLDEGNKTSVIHLNSKDILEHMAKHNACIKVGEASGFMVSSEVYIDAQQKPQALKKKHHSMGAPQNQQMDEHPSVTSKSQNVKSRSLLYHIQFILDEG